MTDTKKKRKKKQKTKKKKEQKRKKNKKEKRTKKKKEEKRKRKNKKESSNRVRVDGPNFRFAFWGGTRRKCCLDFVDSTKSFANLRLESNLKSSKLLGRGFSDGHRLVCFLGGDANRRGHSQGVR